MIDVHRLRVFSAVPESYAAMIQRGTRADISFDGHRGSLAATVSSTAEAIDPSTRTLQIEMQLDNPKGDLLPGAYARVRLHIGSQSALPRIAVTSLLFRPDGLWVAVVGGDHRVRLSKVVPGRDFGTEIEVRDGVRLTDSVVINPPESLQDGAEVRLRPGQGL